MDGYYQHGNGWGLLMVLGMLGIWALVALVVVWLVRSTRAVAHGPQAPHVPQSASAEQILAERLARGDIDVEDYRARVAALKPPG